ncbi:MAG: amidohydrolase, partial [Phycisphaeraceae bacterium]|nr:amidohydrolase [Phycisphaeraceae bacterium]
MIDTHLHLWDPDTIPRSWLAGVPELDRAMGLEAYRVVAAACGIEAAIHVETDVDDTGLDLEVDEVTAVMGRSTLVRAAGVGGRPGHPGFEAWLDGVGH